MNANKREWGGDQGMGRGAAILVTKLIRRTHMYLALFLTPWMLIYGLSTMAMNHREFFKKLHGAGPPAFEVEKEISWWGVVGSRAWGAAALVAGAVVYVVFLFSL